MGSARSVSRAAAMVELGTDFAQSVTLGSRATEQIVHEKRHAKSKARLVTQSWPTQSFAALTQITWL